VIAALAPAILLDHDRHIEPDERAHIVSDEAVGSDDVDHAPRAGERHRHLDDSRIARTGGGVDLLAERHLLREGDEAERIGIGVERGVGSARRSGLGDFDGSSTAIVSAARRMAPSESSLAWAKAVVSPETPRRPKPAWVLKSAAFSRPSSKLKLSDAVYWR
jgi:hypothetical protein